MDTFSTHSVNAWTAKPIGACLQFIISHYLLSDIDECAMNTDKCHMNANCTNTEGSHTCNCISGYTGDGSYCADINECSAGTHNCHRNGVCSNLNGSFACSCPTGFSGNGTFCQDINECLSNPCHSNATCNNLMGSYICICNAGYAGNGTSCSGTILILIFSAACNDCFKNFFCQSNVSCVHAKC